MKNILLQYPDEAPNRNILNDLTVLSRGVGQKGHKPTVLISESGSLDGLDESLTQRGIPNSVGTVVALTETQAVVTDGEDIAITGGTVAFDITFGEITGGAFTADP